MVREPDGGSSVPRALVVDNDSEVRVLVAELLAEQGLDVITAEDGDVALDRMRAGPSPAVVLLDLDMPRMGGMEVLA